MRKAFFIIMLLLPGILFAQTEEKQDVWEPFRFFVGSWEGTEEGRPGIGKVEAYFKFVFQDKFLEMRGRSVWEPHERNPEGEVHEDFGFISYDKIRKKFVLRQFHIEGFVNQYVLDSLSPDGKTFVFLSESIENIPAGWLAKLTYKILNDDEFQVIFELAAPEENFQVYVKGHLKRKN